MGKKECKTCGSSFEPYRSNHTYCRKQCKVNSEGSKKRQREFGLKRRAKLHRIKKESGCVKCGYNENPVALDFNHVRGEKSFTISDDPKKAWHLILAEIAKCEVLCANCHRIHTHEQKQYNWRD